MAEEYNIDDESFFDVQVPSVDVVRLSHLNNKSSVLCPESQNITSQFLALQQLDAHQKMIARAKGIVDTFAPQSLQSYRSIIDRQKKKLWKKSTIQSKTSNLNDDYSGRPPSSFKSHIPFTNDEDNASLNASSMSKAVQTGIPFVTINSSTDDKISWYLEALSQGALLSPPYVYAEDPRSSFQQLDRRKPSSRRRVVNGDILETHVNCFMKSKKPFSPRILANVPVKSKIKDMRCYNPPMRKRKNKSSENSSDTFESYDQEEDSEVEEKFDEKVFNDSSENIETEINRNPSTEKHPPASERLHDYLLSQRRRFTSSNLPDYSNKNAEDKYLDFLSKVTEDILRSGVYSDRAIQQSFEFHLQFYQEENKDKLQSLLSQVLEGLKISNDESDEFLYKKTFSRPSTPPEKEVLPDSQYVTDSQREENSRAEYELDLNSAASVNNSLSNIMAPLENGAMTFRVPDS